MTSLTRSAALLTVLLSMFVAGPAAATGGRDRIEGVVKETRTVAGRTYASISVGSDDAVRGKMRLSVVNRKGEHLGTITVTQVEPEEAIGVLTGPRANEIRADDRVISDGPDDGRIVTSLQRP
jgi:hypothetical protein